MSVIDLAAARARLNQTSPPHPIAEALDALALALVAHDHDWTEREHQLYETAIAYVTSFRTGSGS